MERIFYEELLKWKENTTKPLMVLGARQVGKTYIINEFCKREFDDYIYVNLLGRDDIINIFNSETSFEDKVRKFKFLIGRDIKENTVIFFDEIQESEKLISLLKLFCEDEFPYKIIAAGSLLGVKLKRFKSSFPVGKVVIKKLSPLTFEEFIINSLGKDVAWEIRRCFENNEAMDEQTHQKLLTEFRIYECIGGMPEVVNNYLECKKDINKMNTDTINSIYLSYLADMNKYIDYKSESVKIERVYNCVPNALSKDNKKFKYTDIDKKARKREYESSIDWLIASDLVRPVYNISECKIPLKSTLNYDAFKLFINDSGLLVKMSSTPKDEIMLDSDFRYKGAITENYVVNELINNGREVFYYHEGNVEIDSIIQTEDGKIIPIEIKSGKNNKSKSLRTLMDKYDLNLAYRISEKNFELNNKIKSIPLYACFCIK